MLADIALSLAACSLGIILLGCIVPGGQPMRRRWSLPVAFAFGLLALGCIGSGLWLAAAASTFWFLVWSAVVVYRPTHPGGRP